MPPLKKYTRVIYLHSFSISMLAVYADVSGLFRFFQARCGGAVAEPAPGHPRHFPGLAAPSRNRANPRLVSWSPGQILLG